jgi:hypothetical protein
VQICVQFTFLAFQPPGFPAFQPFQLLASKKNLESDPHTPVGNPDYFSGRHNRLPGFGKHECHGYFLSREQGPAGFDKNAAGAHILDRRLKVGIQGPANGNDRLEFVESFPRIPPSIKTLY